MNYQIRKAIKDDFPEINKLFIEMENYIDKVRLSNNLESFKSSGYEDGYLDSFISDPNKYLYVATRDDLVVGYISFVVYKSDNYIYIDDFSITENYKRKGIGNNFLKLVIDKAKELKISKIRLHVFFYNTNALSFYNKYNFKEIENNSNRLMMELDLEGN